MIHCCVTLLQFFQRLAWIGTGMCMIGSVLVALKKPWGFAIFLVAEGFLAPVQFATHTWAQVANIAWFTASNILALWVAHKELMAPFRKPTPRPDYRDPANRPDYPMRARRRWSTEPL